MSETMNDGLDDLIEYWHNEQCGCSKCWPYKHEILHQSDKEIDEFRVREMRDNRNKCHNRKCSKTGCDCEFTKE